MTTDIGHSITLIVSTIEETEHRLKFYILAKVRAQTKVLCFHVIDDSNTKLVTYFQKTKYE